MLKRNGILDDGTYRMIEGGALAELYAKAGIGPIIVQ